MSSLRERAAFTFERGGSAGRFFIWENSIDAIKENLFLGKGIGLSDEYFDKKAMPGFAHSHNQYLQILFECGIFALLSFLIFVFLLFKKAKKFLRCNFGENNVLISGFMCGLVGFLIHSFFDSLLYWRYLRILFWIMVGVLLAMSTKSCSFDKTEENQKV